MLIQLHWQNKSNPQETEFVAQDEILQGDDPGIAMKRIYEVADRRQGECPEGWMPLICTEDSEFFMWSAKPVQ